MGHLVAGKYKAFITLINLIAFAEVTTCFINPGYGLLAHSLLLITLLCLSSLPHGSNPSPDLFLALSLAPLIRIVSLSLPLALLPKYTWHPISGTVILAAAVALMKIQGLGLRDVGLTLKEPLAQLALGLMGIPFGVMEYLILRPEPLAQEISLVDCILLAIALIFFTGFVEELIFRGIMQGAAIKAMGLRAGLLGVNVIFTILHMGWLSALDMALVFLVGLIFGYTVLKTGSIIGASISHGLTNVILFMVAPSLWKVL